MKTSKWSVISLCLVTALTGFAQAPAEAPKAAASPPAAAAPSVPADPMALLKALPADASAFVAISNLSQLDNHVQGLLQQLQLAGMVPGPLDWIRSSAGLGRGLQENGSLAFVILSLKDAKTPEEIGDRLVVYIPTANPDQMLQSLGGEKDGDVFKITLMGQPTVAAAGKNFVIAAEKPETLKAAIKAPKSGLDQVMSPDRVKAYTSNDIIAWANPSTISPELRTQLRDALTNLMGKMNPGAGALGKEKPAGMEKLEGFFNDVQEFTLGISADSKRGLVVNWFAAPREGSKLAAQMQAYKGVSGSLLQGLPKEPVIGAFACVGAGGDAAKTQEMDQILGQVLSAYASALSAAGVQVDKDSLNTLKDPLIGLFTSMQHLSMSVSGLPVEGGEGRLGMVMVAKVSDSKKWQADARKFFTTLKQLIVDTAKKQGQTDEKINPIADAVQWKVNAQSMDGATIDHLVVDLDKMPKTGENDQAELEKVKTFIGKEGVLFRVAALSDNHVVMTFGGGAKRFAEIVELAKKGDTSLSQTPGLAKIADRLPKGERVMEGYLALDNLLDLIMTTAAQMGSPIPMPLALKNAAPIAFTVSKVTPSATETQVLVPMELMVSVKELVGPLMMMMGGGMQAPPGGGNTPPEQPKGELN